MKKLPPLDPPVKSELQIKIELADVIQKAINQEVVVDAFNVGDRAIAINYEDMEGAPFKGFLDFEGNFYVNAA